MFYARLLANLAAEDPYIVTSHRSAVYQGRVAFADYFPSYGNVVIVNHGDDFFTIYGHLDVMRVRTGEWVDAGAEVGSVGETGSLIGPSLYFEIREGAEAINPAQWLGPRGR